MTRRRSGPVELAVVAAVRSAGEWVDDEDRAAVTLARTVARRIDSLTGRLPDTLFDGAGDADTAGKVGYLANTLLAILGQLGLTPAGRATMGLDDAGADDATLAEIRSIRERPQIAADHVPGDLGS